MSNKITKGVFEPNSAERWRSRSRIGVIGHPYSVRVGDVGVSSNVPRFQRSMQMINNIECSMLMGYWNPLFLRTRQTYTLATLPYSTERLLAETLKIACVLLGCGSRNRSGKTSSCYSGLAICRD